MHHCDASFFFQEQHENQNTIIFTDHSAGDPNIHSWSWEFGDGQTSSEQNPSHTYDHSGTYLVCLYIANEDSTCVDHYCHHVVIHQAILDDHNDHVAQRMAGKQDAFFKGYNNPSASLLDQSESLSQTSAGLQVNEINDPFHLSPNPFNESLTVEFNLEQDAIVVVTMFDLTGKVVHISDMELLPKGHYSHNLAVEDLQDGIYILNVKINGSISIKKVVKTK